jgi:hypothetical protein
MKSPEIIDPSTNTPYSGKNAILSRFIEEITTPKIPMRLSELEFEVILKHRSEAAAREAEFKCLQIRKQIDCKCINKKTTFGLRGEADAVEVCQDCGKVKPVVFI